MFFFKNLSTDFYKLLKFCDFLIKVTIFCHNKYRITSSFPINIFQIRFDFKFFGNFCAINDFFRILYLLKFFNLSKLNICSDFSVVDIIGKNVGDFLKIFRFDFFLILNSFFSSFPFLIFLGKSFIIDKDSFIGDFFIQSFTYLFSVCEWLEREVWDMFGVCFVGNSDLRRILTDYGFSGFPLRKDFPVVGFFESKYDGELLQLRYEKVSLSQEYRFFFFQNF